MMLEAFRHIQGEIRAAVHLNTDLHIRIFLPHLIQDAPWNITGLACIDCKYIVFLWLFTAACAKQCQQYHEQTAGRPSFIHFFQFHVLFPFSLCSFLLWRVSNSICLPKATKSKGFERWAFIPASSDSMISS